ncbi:type IX secretion system sortase PorU, long form, partial [Prevotella sp.]|uniref:type IX secretion system sortase PorU, long form n=1 Tax=Prevotella sp. TaxID=59823 RepID=UPI00307CC11B
MRNIYIVLTLLLAAVQASAQKFYNLTAKEVRVDSVLPIFSHTESLPANYRDSVYSFSIAYAEYADMPRADIEAYQRIEPNLPAAQPRLETSVVMDRKQPSLLTTFCPVVMREGRWQVLVSFMLRRSATPVRSANIISDNETGNIANLKTDNVAERISRLNSITRMGEALHADAVAPQDRYAQHSVLRSGRWVKIRVPSTGVYQLTTELMRKAGFSNPDRVKVYGYGGNLQSETLDSDYLIATDDLHEVPTCTIGSRRLMFARGPVSWSSNDATCRTRNPYSDYGYYFLTDDGTEPQKIDSADFVSSFYPSADYYHDLYEVDGFSWHHGGRNLYDSRQVQSGDSLVLTFEAPEKALTGRLMANVTSGGSTSVEVKLNGRRLGTLNTTASEPLYISGFQSSGTYDIVCDESRKHQTVSLHVLSGDPMRLDFVSLTWPVPHQLGNLATDALPVPEYVYAITNQDHHADEQADMVIIIPTSQKLLAQARRLKQLHENNDGMRVNIVPADELYNEFSSGTPDASAYRRYLKMLYDRATTAADQPKYLVLFGSCMWDNRMLTSECRQMKADDYLLAYESEESFDKRLSYVDDSFYGMLDDGEGLRPLYVDKVDVAVGRFPVTTAADAKTMVDKIES